MNNFDGQLNLYPEICIDNFDTNCLFNPTIKCYILSHFHDDHMKNLEDINFYKVLKEGSSNGVKFLVSPITKKFISVCDKYKHITEFCCEVTCESSIIVNISNKNSVTVTFCGSGHCPGSVMVFIEGSRGNVLFTGDFRLPLNSASRLPFLKDTSQANQSKRVDDLYMDMTFFKPEVPYIPGRDESVKALLEFVHQFLNLKAFDKNIIPDNGFQDLIYLKTSARIGNLKEFQRITVVELKRKLGYEYVFQEINRSTGYKIHVNDLIYRIYDKLPVIQSILTKDSKSTPIHACVYESRKRDLAKTNLMNLPVDERKSMFHLNGQLKEAVLPCELIAAGSSMKKTNKNINSAKIILSAMWFTDTAGVEKIFLEYKPPKKELDSIAYKYYEHVYRLCFSFHSSMEEIIDFVDTIKPKRLYSIALPENTTEKGINEYFYNPFGKFQGFHLSNNKTNLSECMSSHLKTTFENNSVKSKHLVLRKRKSFSNINDTDDSSNESGNRSDSSSLMFGDSDDECKSKFKKFSRV